MDNKTLHERQGWSLTQKIDHSLGVIDQFLSRTEGKAYVAFSGGKDSTVLLHLCRILKPDILAVFVNTGSELPDIVRFVRETRSTGANVRIIQPKLKPRQVWAKYGFPLVSKNTAGMVHRVRYNPDSVFAKKALQTDFHGAFCLAKKWRFLLDAPYETANNCCDKLKKEPSHYIIRELGLAPIVGITAGESNLREKTYIRRGGCNVFSDKLLECSSHPLSIWIEQDVWGYIEQNNVPIADCYHNGLKRTGCVGCGFGVQFPDDNRLEWLYKHYPKLYNHVLSFENNGVSYRDALREVLAVNGLHLPDEL